MVSEGREQHRIAVQGGSIIGSRSAGGHDEREAHFNLKSSRQPVRYLPGRCRWNLHSNALERKKNAAEGESSLPGISSGGIIWAN